MRKVTVKSLKVLIYKLLLELGSWCCVSTDLDWKTIERRSKDEGLPFLTITLPSFGSDFLEALDQGSVGRHLFVSFSRKGELPRFLGGFLDLVFDRGTGRLLDTPSIDAIYAIIQISCLMPKIDLECSKERKEAAIRKYIQCEQDIRKFEKEVPVKELMRFARISDMLWKSIFDEVDRKIGFGEIIPKHGPGTTADGLLGNKKYMQTEWPARLESVFPMREFLISNDASFASELDPVNILEPGQERPVEVLLVPKTQKTPRIIAREPTATQYVQQGILEAIEEAIQANNNARKLISWKYQLPNQQLALSGSLFGDLATLDLSEASDRVSCLLIAVMLRRHPNLAKGVAACRSRTADVPGVGVIPLSKFASMGSALCFPFESMVFMTAIFMGIEDTLNRPVDQEDIKRLLGRVRVYGDDIIIPVEYTRAVVCSLENLAFKVNKSKSFWTGKFRESCGKWYYDGVEVTPIRVRSFLPAQRQNVTEIIRTVALRNQLYKRGLWSTVRYLDGVIERVIPFPGIHHSDTSPALGKVSFLEPSVQKWDSKLQRPLVKGVVVRAVLPESILDGHFALLKFFLKRGDLPVVNVKHLERSGRPLSVNIMTRLVTPY